MLTQFVVLVVLGLVCVLLDALAFRIHALGRHKLAYAIIGLSSFIAVFFVLGLVIFIMSMF